MDDIRYAVELGISVLVFIIALCGVISIGVIARILIRIDKEDSNANDK
tara:strand:+ start:353 stop:496 length:144 start_codon:yes stop_codon:yes gene_type:complete